MTIKLLIGPICVQICTLCTAFGF